MQMPPTIEAYVAPARTAPGAWRILLGLLVIFALWMVGMVLVLLGWVIVDVVANPSVYTDGNAGLDARLGPLLAGADPASLLVVLASFIGFWFGIWLAVALVHEQPVRTIFAPSGRFLAGDFLYGAVLALVMYAVTTIAVLVLVGAPVRTDLALSEWAIYLIPLTVLVFFQAGAEELVFRGYLLQQIARRLSHPIFWAVLPSFGFGLLHFDPTLPHGGGYYYVAATTLFGCVFAALVWRTGNLWAALGIHWANNVIVMIGAGIPDILDGMQLYAYDRADMILLMRIDLASSVLLLAFLLSPLAPRRSAEVGKPG